MATSTLNSPHIQNLLTRLFTEAAASEPALAAIVQSDASRSLNNRSDYRAFYGLLTDIPLPVSRGTGSLLYMLTRCARAQSIVEFGTSFGVSTICLAAGLRDNGGGRIITTEFEPSKAARARTNFREAGLDDLIEIREGDALNTLANDLPQTIDLVLLDGAKPLYGDILDSLASRLRPAALVLADDVRFCPDFVNRMRSDTDHYASVQLADDLEMFLRLS